MDIVFEYKNIRIYHHPLHRVLHLKWEGPDCVDGYVEVLKALRRFTLELEVEAWLMNLGKCQKVQLESLNNLTYVANALTESKLKRYGRVSSQDPDYESLIKEKINQSIKEYNLSLAVNTFETEMEALAWLFEASEGTLEE